MRYSYRHLMQAEFGVGQFLFTTSRPYTRRGSTRRDTTGHGQAVEHLAPDAHIRDLARAGARGQVVFSDALVPLLGALDKQALTQPRGHLPGRAPKALQRRALTTIYATRPNRVIPTPVSWRRSQLTSAAWHVLSGGAYTKGQGNYLHKGNL